MKITDLNKLFKNVNGRFLVFRTLHQQSFLYYWDVNLESLTDAVILHVEMNNNWNDISQSNTKSLIDNVKTMPQKYHSLGVARVFVSGVTYQTG